MAAINNALDPANKVFVEVSMDTSSATLMAFGCVTSNTLDWKDMKMPRQYYNMRDEEGEKCCTF